MIEKTLLGPWVRRFLLEHLVADRNLARNTQQSYRDTLCLLIPFAANKLSRAVDRLTLTDLSADLVRGFLTHLEEQRHCGKRTRNQRLAAIHAFVRFVAEKSPEHIAWCSELRAIPFQRAIKRLIPYLDKPEMDAVLAAANQRTAQGRRDHALLLFLYNSGVRAQEAAQLTIGELEFTPTDWNGQAYVRIRGKGGRMRQCPLWQTTTQALGELIATRQASERVFLNRCKQPLTRFGIHALVKRYARKAAASMPSLVTKRISPHTIRHTTATHLLRAGVDINTIRAWLGHASLNTTNVYAEIDLEMKAKALAKCELGEAPEGTKHWRQDPSLMEFLRNL